MTTALDLDYTAAGVASGDVPNWSGTVQVLASTYLVVRASSDIASGTRPITGLQVDTVYDVSLDVAGFFGDTEFTFTASIAGQSVALTTGVNTVTFTATGSSANLVIDFDGDTSWGPVDIELAGLTVTSDEPPAPAITVTGTTSHLHDEVDIVGNSGTAWDVTLATLPAYVGYQTAGIDNGEGGRTTFLESLRVILPACNFDATSHRIRWRGQLYQSAGPEMLRRRRGRDLTLTVPIKLVTG